MIGWLWTKRRFKIESLKNTIDYQTYLKDDLTLLAQKFSSQFKIDNQMTNVISNQITDIRANQSIERSLLEFLKPKSEGRFSRLEAYCDLLAQAASDSYTVKVVGQQLMLQPGQFISSISELSRKWQWQRATVRQFVDGLQAIQQLDIKPISKVFLFTVNSAQYLSVRIKDVEDLKLFSDMQFKRFINGTATVKETAESLDLYFLYLLETMEKESGLNGACETLCKQQYDTFINYLSSVFFLEDSHIKLPHDLELAIHNYIGYDQICSWYKLVNMLSIVRTSLIQKSESVVVDDDLSKDEAILIRQIFDFYYALVKAQHTGFMKPQSNSDNIQDQFAGHCSTFKTDVS